MKYKVGQVYRDIFDDELIKVISVDQICAKFIVIRRSNLPLAKTYTRAVGYTFIEYELLSNFIIDDASYVKQILAQYEV